MALSNKEKQEMLCELEEAIYKGVQTIRFRDKTIEYRSLAEMQNIRDMLRRELGLQATTVRLFAKHSKGTC